MSAQYHLALAKKDERVGGPDDADVVLTAPVDAVTAEGFDATTEFMRGKLKASGHTGVILDLLRSGEATAAFSRLASEL